MKTKPILIISAQRHVRQQLQQTLQELDLRGVEVSSLDEAVRAVFQRGPFSAILCEAQLPDGCALNFVHWLREQIVTTPIIVLADGNRRFPKIGAAFQVLAQPIDADRLFDCLSRLGLLRKATRLAVGC